MDAVKLLAPERAAIIFENPQGRSGHGLQAAALPALEQACAPTYGTTPFIRLRAVLKEEDSSVAHISEMKNLGVLVIGSFAPLLTTKLLETPHAIYSF